LLSVNRKNNNVTSNVK